MTLRRRPVALHHAGRVETDRAWIPLGPRGFEGAERRVWAGWEPGLRVDRAPIGLVLRFPGPRRLSVVDGWVPLVDVRGRWCASPLDPRDVEGFEAGSILVMQGFAVRAVGPAELTPVEVWRWLEVDGLEVLDATPLGRPPPAPVEVVGALPQDPAAVLGLAPVVPGADALATALASGAVAGGRLAQLGRSVAAGALGWLARLGRAVTPSREESREGAGAPRRGWLGWLERMSGQLGLASALGRMVGEQHLRYLQRMMSLFDSGQWDDALRHAIPLDGQGGAESGGGWLQWLAPRSGLAWSAPRGAGGSSVGVGPQLFEMLQAMYRRAHEQLDRAGRVREAAYVLAQLLGKTEEAVTYLEDHDELRLAAELAEARELAPGRVVSLWFRVGDHDRALALARRHDAWDAAVTELERRDQSALAAELRVIWARQEAAAGRHAAAVAIVWPVEHMRTPAREWLWHAMRVPGVAGAQALARFAARFPEEREEAEAALRGLLEAGPSAASARARLASELRAHAAPAAAWMAQPLVRRLLHDLVDGVQPNLAPLRKAIEAVAPAGLQADLPSLPARSPSVRLAAQTGVELTVSPHDVGTVEVYDVLDLPGDRWLLALGELGLRIVDHTGRVLREFAPPAHHLVGQHGENLAVLAVARRGRTVRVSRVDVVRQSLSHWLDLALSAFSPTFDGHLWFVAEADRVMALDVHAAQARAVWSIPDLSAGALAATETELQVVEHGGDLYRYRVPRLTLDRRHAPTEARLLEASAGLRLAMEPGWFGDFPFPHQERVVFGPEMVAVVERGGDPGAPSVRIRLFTGLTKHLVHRATLEHPGASGGVVRWLGYDLAVVDKVGRIRVLSGASGRLRLDLRV